MSVTYICFMKASHRYAFIPLIYLSLPLNMMKDSKIYLAIFLALTKTMRNKDFKERKERLLSTGGYDADADFILLCWLNQL